MTAKVTGNYHFHSWMKEGRSVDFEEDEEHPLMHVGQVYPGTIEGMTPEQEERMRGRVEQGYHPVFVFTPADEQVRLL